MHTEKNPLETWHLTRTAQTATNCSAIPADRRFIPGLYLIPGNQESGRTLQLLDCLDAIDIERWSQLLLVTTPVLARTVFAEIRHPRLRILWNAVTEPRLRSALAPRTLLVLHPFTLFHHPTCQADPQSQPAQHVLHHLAEETQSTILAIAPDPLPSPSPHSPTDPASELHASAADFLLRALSAGELPEQELISRANDANIPLPALVAAGRLLNVHRSVRMSRHSRHRVWRL